MRRGFVILVLALAATVLSTSLSAAQVVSPVGTPLVHAPGWWKLNSGTATSGVQDGPAPNGWGARSLVMQTGNSQTIVSTSLVVLPGLSRPVQLETLRYHTLVEPPVYPALPKAPTMQLAVDVDGDRLWDTHLVFDPAFNGGVTPGVWQQWETHTGLWYSTRDVLGMGAQAQLLTLSEINNRSRAMHGAYTTFSLLPADPMFHIRIQYGSSGGDAAGLRARVDGVVIQQFGLPRTRHDFEDPITYLGKLLLP